MVWVTGEGRRTRCFISGGDSIIVSGEVVVRHNLGPTGLSNRAKDPIGAFGGAKNGATEQGGVQEYALLQEEPGETPSHRRGGEYE